MMGQNIRPSRRVRLYGREGGVVTEGWSRPNVHDEKEERAAGYWGRPLRFVLFKLVENDVYGFL